MTLLARYLQHERWYQAGLMALFLFVNNTILATSAIMEAGRAGRVLPTWQPFLWEYTSALAMLPMVLFAAWLDRRFAFQWSTWRRSIGVHIVGSLIFCGGHVLLMVGLRKAALGWSNYDFGNVPLELFYEYRKDAWTYLLLIAVFYSYRFTLSRLRGEAHMIGEGESGKTLDPPPDRLLIKKFGKEFIIKVEDVEWLEAAGNYVNLHIGARIYPLRSTLGGLMIQLAGRGFIQVHRSYGVNLEHVDCIEPLESGDAIVKLKSNVEVNLSRRYREAFKARLGIAGS